MYIGQGLGYRLHEPETTYIQETTKKGRTMSRPTLALPETEAQRLRDLREGGPNSLPALRARVAVLRDAGWSLAAVGAPLGANRSTTRMWQTSARPEDVAESVKTYGRPPAAPERKSTVKVVRLYPDVPVDERDELIRLATSARRIRGWTAQDSQQRKDAKKFEELLRNYKRRGVPVKRMAEHLGITHHALAARLDRAEGKHPKPRAKKPKAAPQLEKVSA